MNTQLDIREEAAKAKQWRKARGFTLDELAHLSGYSVSAIVWFERGITPAGTPTDRYAWHRYKRICSAIEQDRDGQQFSWRYEATDKLRVSK